MSILNAASTPPSTDTKPKVSSAPTPSAKRAVSRLSPGTKSFIRQMAENLRTHDPKNPQGSAQVGVGDPEAAKAESAQTRGIEVDQARLQDQFASKRYQAAPRAYLEARVAADRPTSGTKVNGWPTAPSGCTRGYN